MTPRKRRKLFRVVLILVFVVVTTLASRLLFFHESLPALILGRKPGSADSGTALVRQTLAAKKKTSSSSSKKNDEESLEAKSPLKLKFDTLGKWQYIEGKTSIPENVKQLDGKWVELTGFMMPINESEHITRFILIQSLWGCCFGQTPAVNHIVLVEMKSGKTVDFYPDPVRVIGKLSVGEIREEGTLVSIYRVEGDQVVVR